MTNILKRMSKKKRNAQSMVASGKATITRLVCRRQWSLLGELLRQDDPEIIPIDDAVGHPITSDLLVHFVCRFQAPISIVRIVAKTYPESLHCADALGRFPIHIASAWGASPATIQFLIDEHPVAASIQDNEGKAPIHHLCQSFVLNYQDASIMSQDTSLMSTPVTDSMLSIVDMLKTAAPHSFNLEDNDEMNAVEYALLSESDIKVVKIIQRACRDDWRERKKETDASHDALQDDLQRIQMDLRSQHLSSSSPRSSFTKRIGESTGVPITGQLGAKTQAARMA
mmetsp:Transcript_2904/g.4347  ORF Transcript_2904/g.4347 Transcript_2904/m.4347 type:complete len:284 (+) Transcript_2904:141-992(+)